MLSYSALYTGSAPQYEATVVTIGGQSGKSVKSATYQPRHLSQATRNRDGRRLDEIQWEVKRLGAENRMLREDHPGTADLVHRKAELDEWRWGKGITKLTDRTRGTGAPTKGED